MSEQESGEVNTSGADLRRADTQQAHSARVQRLRSNGDSSVIGVAFHKVCCVCGEVLNHKARFKDAQGRYWCPTCNEADQKKVGPAICADCAIEMSRLDMKEINGLLLCPVCVQKCVKETKAVVDLRLRALAHGQSQTRPAYLTKHQVKAKSNALLYALLAAIVLATIVAVILTFTQKT